MTDPKSYKDTVLLPKTTFEMRANATRREPEIQQFWAEHNIYEHLAETNPGEPFVLHDGPPYANGDLHIGHALNKILKDIINKYQLLQGRKVRYVPGWDCHGLPIELKVLQTLKKEERAKLTPLGLRQKAREFATETIDKQRQGFKRFGVWGDWEHPYATLQPEYEAAQLDVFGKMVENGHIYRGLKPVYWSPSSLTALAEAELEYPDNHVSRSVYVVFAIASLSDKAQTSLKNYSDDLGLAVWTTTPWTLVSNQFTRGKPDLKYAVVEGFKTVQPQSPKYVLVAADAVERLSQLFETELVVKATLLGKELAGSSYQHPLFDQTNPVIASGDDITADSGTGLVHCAPAHGPEDFFAAQEHGIEPVVLVDEAGRYTAGTGQFEGLKVLTTGTEAVIEALTENGTLLKEDPYAHSYPYDWRTKKPVIYRATEQWFASVAGFRDEALSAIEDVEWIPASGQNRITAMVGDRSDWCISRQRSWGMPIPVFYDEATNEPLMNQETIGHIRKIFAEKGSDAWWELPVEDLLPPSYLNNGHTYRKGTDTMDVWFDSGSSWAAVADQRVGLHYPVELYLEGSDQHRGWFQSSLLTSVATHGCAPYRTVLTHGFALDEQGRKMSKSLGNVMDPYVIMEGGKNQKQDPPYGADVLRLWVSSVDYSSDVPIGKTILKQMADVYRKIRNTSRFLLGNLHDFDPAKDAVPYDRLPALDRYMLHRITEVFQEVDAAFESYQFFRFFQTVQNFCVVDLSNFYLDVAKDRLYISADGSLRRRSCQTVLAVVLENLAKAIAPVLSHMAEDIWQFMPYETGHRSVFGAGWLSLEPQWAQPKLTDLWSRIREIRDEVNKVLEQARSAKDIGSSLGAKALLYVADTDLRQLLAAMNPTDSIAADNNHVDELRYLFLVSQVELLDSPAPLQGLKYRSESDALGIGIVDAEGEKCDRCWNYSTRVGESQADPTLCERCVEALSDQF
ncbi:MAG: isoleucine--tRNA ligase [Cyanobacteria bacterium P01_A01_bin.114]